jgi:hypothetical protein
MYELAPHRRHKNKERPSHGKGQQPKKVPKKYVSKPKGKSYHHKKDIPNDAFHLINEPHHTTSESAFDAYIRNFVWKKMKGMLDDAFLSHLLYILGNTDESIFKYKPAHESERYILTSSNIDFKDCIDMLRHQIVLMIYNQEGIMFSPCMDLYLMNSVKQNIIVSLWNLMSDTSKDCADYYVSPTLQEKQMEKEQYESHPLRDLIPFERLEDRYDDYSDYSDDDW